jgi:hypothetical protein
MCGVRVWYDAKATISDAIFVRCWWPSRVSVVDFAWFEWRYHATLREQLRTSVAGARRLGLQPRSE